MHHDPDGRRPRVAAIIPCFNASKYIGEAVESALGQTYGHVDVIVVNDGSTDDFDRAIAPFRDRITLISQPNSGQGAARNRGMAAARATFVAFLDADDRWHPEKTSRQVATLAAHPECGLVHSARRLVGSAGATIPRSPLTPELREQAHGDCLWQLIQRNSIIISSVMVRRSLLDGERFSTDMGGVEDWDMWVRLAGRTRFAWIDEPLTDYRVHETNFSWDTRTMSRATVKLMDGVLRREQDPKIRLAAAAQRREYMLEVAHLEFERGDHHEARRWFSQAFPRLKAADLVRYGATYVPDSLHLAVRSAWRVLRRSRA
jgi:glycosyltransferase involved in cell wall biosynthesis